MASTPELIEQAATKLLDRVPALGKLRLAFGLELRGRGDIQHYRVEVPGPKVTKAFGEDERLKIQIPRPQFNELAADGRLGQWIKAYEQGHIKVEGDTNVQKALGKVIAQAESRASVRKAH